MPNIPTVLGKPHFPMRSMSQLHENTDKNGTTRFICGTKPAAGLSLDTDLNRIDEEANERNGEKRLPFQKEAFQEEEEEEEEEKKEEQRNNRSILRNRTSSNRFNNHRNSFCIRNKRHSHHRRSTEVSEQDADEEELAEMDNPNMDKILKLDIFARTVFPLFYVILTAAYFIYYTGTRTGS